MLGKFRYFRAPESEMFGLLSGVRTCSLCGQPGRCFSLESRVVSLELNQEERQGKIGCVECLKRDRFGFSHMTKAGLITEDGLMRFELEEASERVFIVSDNGHATTTGGPAIPCPQEHVSEEAAAELRRTPCFSTWQDLDWPVHHEDFMAYSGLWEPKDFERLAGVDTARASFVGMVNPAWHDLWPEGKVALFGENIVVFECLHCVAKIGIPDFD